jgi:hypothetical protein
MTEQPNPDVTDSSLEHAEQLAADEAALEASGESTSAASQAGPPTKPAGEPRTGQGAASADATEPASPKVTKAQARTSQPVPAGSAARGRETSGSGNGHHRELVHTSAEHVRAETVSLHQASAQTVEADSIDIRQGAAARVEARDLTVTGGAVGFARADRVSVELGAAGAAVAGEAHVTQSAVNAVIARQANVEQSLVQTVIAADVRFERPSAVVFLVSRRVEGEVRAVLDWRGALVFGVAVGLVSSLLRRRR